MTLSVLVVYAVASANRYASGESRSDCENDCHGRGFPEHDGKEGGVQNRKIPLRQEVREGAPEALKICQNITENAEDDNITSSNQVVHYNHIHLSTENRRPREQSTAVSQAQDWHSLVIT